MENITVSSMQRKRGSNFREDETKVLIQLWGSPQIQKKLYLAPCNEPVMRLLAFNMQQRGFYRTPDEIKTRIRNLKYLYHRINRTVLAEGETGTVEPDWPHYKAMHAIFTKQTVNKENLYQDNVIDGPPCDEIKQEIIDDIDIVDDMESHTSNSMASGSEYEDEQVNMSPLTPDPKKKDSRSNGYQKSFPKILPNLTLPIQPNSTNKQGSLPLIPFPLLILNGLQTHNGNSDKNESASSPSLKTECDNNKILKELLEVQKEKLVIERKRLELDQQRLEFERSVGSQLIALGPVIGGLWQKMRSHEDNESGERNVKRRRISDDFDISKESKILNNLLSEGIKNCMMGQESDNEHSAIHDEASSSSK